MADMIKASTNNIGSVGLGQNPNQTTRQDKTGGPSFKDALGQFNPAVDNKSVGAEALGNLVGKSTNVKFSNHAIERMRARGISFDPKKMQAIEDAIDKVAAKGGKNTLLLTDDSALIVSTANKTVVTVMDKQNLKENVFTNIDSTMVL